MVIVHNSDMHKYYDKQRRVGIIKYNNGVKKTQFDGGAIYLPRRLYDGDGLFNDIVKFVSDNKDTIKNITGAVVDSIGKVGTTTLVIVKKREN